VIWLKLRGHGLRWQGGSRDTAFGRTNPRLALDGFRACESGVALRFPPQSMTRFVSRRLSAIFQRPQNF
jgi:hypothetical protein